MRADPPTRLFSLVDGRPRTDIPLQPHVVWLGEVRGRVYGVVTSPISCAIPVSDDVIRRHGFVSDIQRCFLSQEFVSLMAVDPVDLDEIFDELGTAPLSSASVEVDGIPVPAAK